MVVAHVPAVNCWEHGGCTQSSSIVEMLIKPRVLSNYQKICTTVCIYTYILIMFHFIGLLRYLLVVEVQYEARKLCCFTTGNGHLTSKHCICSTDLNGYF